MIVVEKWGGGGGGVILALVSLFTQQLMDSFHLAAAFCPNNKPLVRLIVA